MTEAEYDLALARIDELFDSEVGSDDFKKAERLIALVKIYEEKYYKI